MEVTLPCRVSIYFYLSLHVYMSNFNVSDLCAWLELLQQSEYCCMNARDDIRVLACCLNEELLFSQTPSGHVSVEFLLCLLQILESGLPSNVEYCEY